MSEENKSLVDTSSVDNTIVDIANQVMNESSPDKTKDLVALFNWNISKKNVSRILKLNELYDKVSSQMEMRLTSRGDQFSNSDLIDYLKTIQGAIDSSSKVLSQVDETPTIVQNHNTQINVNVVDKFDRDAKERILAAIQATLQSVSDATYSNGTPSDIVVEDVKEIMEDERCDTDDKP